MTASSEQLYQINDALTALAADLGVRATWDEMEEDERLQTATMCVAEAFGWLYEEV